MCLCLAIVGLVVQTPFMQVQTAEAATVHHVVAPPSDLMQVDASEVPKYATWHSLANPGLPPAPCFGFIHSLHPAWTVYYSPSSGQGLKVVWMDDSSLYSLQADSMQSGPLTADSSQSNEDARPTYGPDALWIQVLAVTNDTATAAANLIIHPPDAEIGSVFDVFYTPSLQQPLQWYWVYRTMPWETNLCAGGLGLDSGYFKIADTNGPVDPTTGLTAACMGLVGAAALTNDLNGNSIPDLWEVTWLGGLHPADYSVDGTTTLYHAWLTGTDPNPITAMPRFASFYVKSSTVNGSFAVSGGAPAQMAILLNSTNLNSATWQPYSQNFTLTLGSTDGVYTAWLGLKGRSVDSTPAWNSASFTRQTTVPSMFVTSPTDNHVTQSALQLSGYTTNPASITWRVDPAGVTGNGCTLGRFYDTNRLDFTTNWFTCLNLPLTKGANTVTLYASDLAGNMATNASTFYFDYPTNPPTLSLYWPSDGTLVSGSQFTLRGWVSDPTASVVAQIVDASGNTHSVPAIVGRNGLVWAENVPLAGGTNTISLIATDVATNMTTNNFTVLQSEVHLVIDPNSLAGPLANQPRVRVLGTIDSTNYTVWVNGVAATILWENYDGTWEWAADGVRLPAGGTAVLQARAIPNTDHGGQGTGGSGGRSSTYADPGNPSSSSPGPEAQLQTDKPTEVVEIHYDLNYDSCFTYYNPPGDILIHNSWDVAWDAGAPGHDSWWRWIGPVYAWCDWNWGSDGTGFSVNGGSTVYGDKSDGGLPYPITAPTSWPGVFAQTAKERPLLYPGTNTIVGTESVTRKAHTRYELHTGGKAGSTRQNLFVGTINLQGISNPFYPDTDANPGADNQIVPTSVVLSDLGQLGNDWLVYKVLPDDATNDVTPIVAGSPYHTFGAPDVTKRILSIIADVPGVKSATLDPDTVVTSAQFIVGYKFIFSTVWDQPPPNIQSATNQWDFSGHWRNAGTNASTNPYCSKIYFPDSHTFTNDVVTNIWWVSGGFSPPEEDHATVDLGLTFSNGQHVVVPAKGLFDMYKPEAKITPVTTRVTVGAGLLVFGDKTTSPVTHGIIFSNIIKWPTNSAGEVFSGQVYWIQVDSDPKATELEFNGTNHTEVMNGPAPYGDYDEGGNILWPLEQFVGDAPFDDPQIPVQDACSREEASDHLAMWMLCVPTGGRLAPLRTVEWYWHGVATNGPSGWGLQSNPGDHSVSPQDQPTEDYPIWKSNVRDWHWQNSKQ